MLRAVAVASIIAAACADCTWGSTAEFLNFGVNRGGCYECDVSSTYLLVETCRALCLDDANCKSFETAPEGPDYYDSVWGIAFNCCIEYTDSTDTSTENWWVSAEDAGDCAYEASLWTTHEPADYDISPCVQDTSIDTSVCTLVDCCVSYDADHLWGMLDGCDTWLSPTPRPTVSPTLAPTVAPTPVPKKKSSASAASLGLIIGGVIGGFAVLALVVVGGVFIAMKSRKPAAQPAPSDSEPAPIAFATVEKPTHTKEIQLELQQAEAPKARFDPLTGAPIPKFDPMTGKQNW